MCDIEPEIDDITVKVEMPAPVAVNNILTKKEFCQQYVLGRANTSTASLSGSGAAKEALAAWEAINGN